MIFITYFIGLTLGALIINYALMQFTDYDED